MNRNLVYIDLPDGSQVLNNKFNCMDPKKLKELELAFVFPRINMAKKISGDFDFKHLCKIHKTIFGELYPYWAGTPREWDIIKRQKILNGESVDYCHFRNIEATIEQKTTSLKRLLMRIL